MQIDFPVAGIPARFHFDPMLARAEMWVGQQHFVLQGAMDMGSAMKINKTYRQEAFGHLIEIDRRRPIFFPAFRSPTVTIKVDGQVVAKSAGK